MEMFKKAQTPGWTLTGEAAELIEKAINIETDEDTKSRTPTGQTGTGPRETRKVGRSPTLNATHWLLTDPRHIGH